ncbi:MAG: epoxyqueuosine reductase QueH, partial [Lachnospiraceae bacterium]|nr:epoxyqueuosine reductase QueH [Lachnospiraceae bacterium]
PLLNTIGREMGERYEITFLPSDFKKKNGYKRSIELSQKYDLYRQDYCGCAFSKAEREEQKRKIEENHT